MADVTLPGVLLSGTHAARPAATAVAKGTLYAETDTGQIFQSDGATWSAWGAAGMVDPTTTRGDLLVRGASALGRLAIGAAGKILSSDGTDASWGSGPLTTKGDLFVYTTTGARLAIGTDGYSLVADSAQSAGMGWKDRRAQAIEFVIDGGGSTITTGLKGYLEVPFACTITAARLLADQSGSIVVNVWKTSYANFDAGGTHPVSGDKITASAPPTISSATKSQDTTLTGWTTSLSAGDILAFNVDSVTTIQRATLSLTVNRT